jgi:uncharacterized protein YoxC
MPMLLPVCLALATLSLLAIALATLRAVRRFERVADDLEVTTRSIREAVTELAGVTREARGVVAAVNGVMPRLRGLAGRFEDLGNRVAQMSAEAIERVESPVRAAVAVARAARRGAARLVGRPWTQKRIARPSELVQKSGSNSSGTSRLC